MLLERTKDESPTKLDPVVITFGPNSTSIEIVDGTAALSYLFSILKPPDKEANWKTYWTPLLVLFSKFLYLAFIDDDIGNNNEDNKMKMTEVPIMANVMYLAESKDVNTGLYVWCHSGLQSTSGGSNSRN